MTELNSFELTPTQIKSLLIAAHNVTVGTPGLMSANKENLYQVTAEIPDGEYGAWIHKRYKFFDGRSIRKLEEYGLVEAEVYERYGIQRRTAWKVVESFPRARVTERGFAIAMAITKKLLSGYDDPEVKLRDILWKDDIDSCTITLKI